MDARPAPSSPTSAGGLVAAINDMAPLTCESEQLVGRKQESWRQDSAAAVNSESLGALGYAGLLPKIGR
jgi:hypothetical protein